MKLYSFLVDPSDANFQVGLIVVLVVFLCLALLVVRKDRAHSAPLLIRQTALFILICAAINTHEHDYKLGSEHIWHLEIHDKNTVVKHAISSPNRGIRGKSGVYLLRQQFRDRIFTIDPDDEFSQAMLDGYVRPLAIYYADSVAIPNMSTLQFVDSKTHLKASPVFLDKRLLGDTSTSRVSLTFDEENKRWLLFPTST